MGKGSFTLPGEAGYETLTLQLADKWGADVIRDSDGTALSDEITKAGYGIYSTICIIRDHNEWAKKNQDKLQQTFLMTSPVTADSGCLAIALMTDFFTEQFRVNDSAEAMRYGTGRFTTGRQTRSWTRPSGATTRKNREYY